MLLHKSSTTQASIQRLQSGDFEDLFSARSLVRNVLEDSLMKLQGEATKHTRSIRWELGACWVQHLQNQASGKTESKKTEEMKVEPAVKGLGKQGGLLKEIKKKIDDRSIKTEQGKDALTNSLDMNKKLDASHLEKQDEEKEMMWRKLLPEAAYLRLKESETGLHLKVGCCFLKRLLISLFFPFLFGHLVKYVRCNKIIHTDDSFVQGVIHELSKYCRALFSQSYGKIFFFLLTCSFLCT